MRQTLFFFCLVDSSQSKNKFKSKCDDKETQNEKHLLATENQSLLHGWNAFLLFHAFLDSFNLVVGFNVDFNLEEGRKSKTNKIQQKMQRKKKITSLPVRVLTCESRSESRREKRTGALLPPCRAQTRAACQERPHSRTNNKKTRRCEP